METILVVMNTPWEVVKIRPEKKSGRPVRNNEKNSKLAKFATYDGFMVKKKNKTKQKTCFSQFIKLTVKNANLICRISPQAKPNLLADSKMCRLNIVTTILSLASLRTDTT